MAGGTTVLGGLVAVPALAVGGILLAAKGTSNLEKAHELSRKSNEAIEKFQKSIALMTEIKTLTKQVSDEITQLHRQYKNLLSDLSEIVKTKNDFRKFTPEEAKTTELCILSVKLLKSLTTIDLLTKDKQAVNKKRLMTAIQSSKEFASSPHPSGRI